MKLFMLNVDIVPVSMEVKMPSFRIAFADSNSNAKSNPLIKLFFAILLLFAVRPFSWSASENLEVTEPDLIVVFRRGNILRDTETPITIIANRSMNDVIKKIISWELNVINGMMIISLGIIIVYSKIIV